MKIVPTLQAKGCPAAHNRERAGARSPTARYKVRQKHSPMRSFGRWSKSPYLAELPSRMSLKSSWLLDGHLAR